MKILKSIAIISLLLVSISVLSQNPEKKVKTPEEKAKHQLKSIQKECNLSAEQTIKVEQILLNTQNKLISLKASKPTQKGEKLQALKVINDNQSNEIEKVLNPEQYTKYQALIEKQKEKIRNRMIEKRSENADLPE